MTLANSRRRKYLAESELTPAFLSGLAAENQGEPNHREVLDFVGVRQHDFNAQMPAGVIMRRHRVEVKDQRAHIVGFVDRSVDIGEEEFAHQMLEPFQIKNKAMHGPDRPAYQKGADGSLSLAEAQVTEDTFRLDRARLNLVVESFLGMCNDRQFRYVSGADEDSSDLIVTIPYDHEIALLTDLGAHPESTGDLNTPSTAKVLYEYRAMKAEYRKKYGAPPDLMFINPTTAGVILTLPDVIATYKPLSSSDPDNRAMTYEAFMYDGIMHITWHNDYVAADGAGGSQYVSAVDDGYGILMRSQSSIDGGPPMRWERAQTALNAGDASGPYFDLLVEGSDPKKIGVRMYDNGIPAPAEKFIIQKVKLYTPT